MRPLLDGRAPAGADIAFLVGLSLSAVLLGACRAPDSTPEMRIAASFITEDPAGVLSSSQVYRSRPVFTWTFERAEDLAAWSSPDDDPAIRDDGLVAPAAEFPRLVRPVEYAAKEIDRIEVTLAGFAEGRLQLFWSGPGQRMDRERRLVVEPLRDEAAGEHGYAFEVASHPLWKGGITALRFDVRSESSQEIRLRAIRGLARELDPERLAHTVGRVWKVDLDHDVRNALPAPPGLEIARELEVAADSRLRFAYGTDARIGQTVEFRVAAEAAGSPRRVLFSDRIAADRRGAWQEASVDLSDLGGRRVRLLLETANAGDLPLREGLPYWANPMVLATASGPLPPDIVLIVIDTLRADRLSLYGYPSQTTPEIDRWARRRGVTFRRVVAPAPWTLPSHISIFTGLDALNHGHNHDLPMAESMESLAELLRRRGYRTAAFTGGVYLHPRYGLAQGFDSFRYWPSDRDQKDELAEGVERALAWLGTNPVRPSFLFFHTYEVHIPFHARQPFLDRLTGGAEMGDLEARLSSLRERSGEEEGFQVRKRYALKPLQPDGEKTLLPDSEFPRVGDLYDSGVAYADSQIGRLLERLGDDAVVVLTSDHGEALGERGFASHSYLYDFNLLVPLIVAVPGGEGGGGTVSRQVRLVDVLPTILDVAGLEVPGDLDGVSLRPWIEDPESAADPPPEAWAYAGSTNFGVALRLSDRLKYIYNNSAWPANHGQEELYRLRADPGEEDNRAAEEADLEPLRRRTFEKVRRSLKGLRADFVNPGPRSHELTFSDAHFLRPGRVKALELGGAVTAWRTRPSRLAIQLPPASELGLFFESVSTHDPLRIAGSKGPPCRVDLAELAAEEPLRLELDEAGCRPAISEGPSPGGVTVTLHLHGLADAPPPPSEVDAELAEKLRALGYLN